MVTTIFVDQDCIAIQDDGEVELSMFVQPFRVFNTEYLIKHRSARDCSRQSVLINSLIPLDIPEALELLSSPPNTPGGSTLPPLSITATSNSHQPGLCIHEPRSIEASSMTSGSTHPDSQVQHPGLLAGSDYNRSSSSFRATSACRHFYNQRDHCYLPVLLITPLPRYGYASLGYFRNLGVVPKTSTDKGKGTIWHARLRWVADEEYGEIEDKTLSKGCWWSEQKVIEGLEDKFVRDQCPGLSIGMRAVECWWCRGCGRVNREDGWKWRRCSSEKCNVGKLFLYPSFSHHWWSWGIG